MQAQRHVVAHLQPFHKVNSWIKKLGGWGKDHVFQKQKLNIKEFEEGWLLKKHNMSTRGLIAQET